MKVIDNITAYGKECSECKNYYHGSPRIHSCRKKHFIYMYDMNDPSHYHLHRKLYEDGGAFTLSTIRQICEDFEERGDEDNEYNR